MKKCKLYGLLVMLLILCTTGCAKDKGQQLQDEPKKIVPTGEFVPIAEFQEVNFPFEDPNIEFVWCGDSFVYMERQWDDQAQRNICTLYRVDVAADTEPVQIYQSTPEEPSIWCFTMDSKSQTYSLSFEPLEDNNRQWSLHKYDENMQEIISVLPDTELVSEEELNNMYSMTVDSNNNLILIDRDNNIYFFDTELNFLWRDSIPNSFHSATFADAGKQGNYFCCYDAMMQIMSLLKIDYSNRCLIELEDISIQDYVSGIENANILSGYEHGILISTNNSLLKYNPENNEVTKWIDWNDININVNGQYVRNIIFHQDNIGETDHKIPLMSVLCYETRMAIVSEIAQLYEIDKAYVPERKRIILGTCNAWASEKWIKKFNRTTNEYEVVIKEYADVYEFVKALISEEGEIPDIFDISWTSSVMLENKGLLEDLQPYFEKSEVVKKEDILTQIWDMCMTNNKLSSMIINYRFYSCVTTAETIPDDGWTTDEFFALQEQYPESRPLVILNENNVWNVLGETGKDSFIDWEKKTCSFDSDEFRALIEKIKNIDYSKYDNQVYQEEDQIKALLNGEALVRQDNYWTPYWYRRIHKKYKGKIRDVGYPSKDGTPCYMISPDTQYAIYSQSKNKAGAWAFIEFLVSEENQNWYGCDISAFPVHKKAFEEFLRKPESPFYSYLDDDMSIDTYGIFTNMIEHSSLKRNYSMGTISLIIMEELQAYYAGDKTVEETSKIIQNRVQLYLDENY